MNINEWLLDRCKTAQEKDRVYFEITEYEKRGMIIVLKFLKYLMNGINNTLNQIWDIQALA